MGVGFVLRVYKIRKIKFAENHLLTFQLYITLSIRDNEKDINNVKKTNPICTTNLNVQFYNPLLTLNLILIFWTNQFNSLTPK